MNSPVRRWVFLLIVVAAVLMVDQFTKQVIVNNLVLGESVRPIPALYPLFQITRSENNGAAFGFLPPAGDLVLIIALIVVIAMIFFYPRIPENARLTQLAMALVVGGALGNALDRLTHGAVI